MPVVLARIPLVLTAGCRPVAPQWPVFPLPVEWRQVARETILRDRALSQA
jgi:hypothetical protein